MPVQKASLYARVSGIVSEQFVSLGDDVKKGQVLAMLDAPEAAEGLAAARSATKEEFAEHQKAVAGVEAAKAAINAAKAELAGVQEAAGAAAGAAEYRNTQSQRLDELAKDGSASTRAREEAKENLRAAKAEFKSKHRAVVAAEAEIERAEAQLQVAKAAALVAQVRREAADEHLARLEASDPLQIKSPLDGRIIEVNGSRHRNRTEVVGSLVAATGQRKPLFIVARTDLFITEAEFAERDARQMKVGDTAVLYIQELHRRLETTISRIGHSVDGQTVPVEAVIDNPKGDLLPVGMHSQFIVPLETHKDALVVGAQTHGSDDNRVWLWRVVDGRLRKTYVRLGGWVFGEHEILEGLSEGDVVLANFDNHWPSPDALHAIKENAKVEIDPGSATDR
jgi:multidrug efflux pump subunit AcrA (membrane-fusion protein)